MIIDDKSLRVGSANLNNRSMGFDTEYDVSVIAGKKQDRHRINQIRNDMIREHTGYDHDVIQNIVEGNTSVQVLVEPKEKSRQHLINIDDRQFKTKWFVNIITKIADPRRPYFSDVKTYFRKKR
jgi:hypothetical protein